MKRRSFLALVGSTSVAGSLAFGSGAFSESTVDRSTEVAVVGDDDAYLALEFPENAVAFGCSTDLDVTIRNRTSQSLDTLSVQFSTGVGSIDGLSPSGPGSYDVDTGAGTVSLDGGSLGPGESVGITATVAGFTGTGTTELDFGVTASGESLTVTTTSDRTVGLDYDCPTAPGQNLAACSSSSAPSVQPPSISVPGSPCDPLEFSQTNLPDKSTIDLSQSPSDLRTDLSGETGIEIDDKIEEKVAGEDDRDDPLQVLSDDLSSNRIEEMPDSPSSNQTFKLGGSYPEARVGRTENETFADIPGGVTLKNFSTVVGELDVDGSFKLKGGSAVAGDVTTETVETVKNALLLGSLETTNGGNSLSITSEAVVCGSVDAAGSISQIKQSRIDGDLSADGDISEINEATVAGDVTTRSDGDITVKQSSLVDGDVDAAGNISEVGSSEVTGKLEADGDISTVKQSTIGGKVTTTDGSSGDITIEESTVGGAISADGNIPALKSVSEVDGPVEAGGTISAIKTSTVDGSVTAPEISQLEGVEINGRVEATKGANKDITVKDNNGESVICGDVVSTNGRVEKIKNSKVNGSVEAAQVGTLKGSSTEVGRSVRTTDGNADLNINGATVYGVVDAAGPIPEIKQARVEGSVTAGGEVNVNESVVCTATGASLTTENGGKLKVKSVSSVGGSIDAAGPIEAIKGNSTVEGNVESGDKVAEISTATIDGDVTADGKIEEIKGSNVRGTVTAGGKVKINDSETGPVETNSGGNLTVKSSSTVGPITLDGDVTKIKGSEVEGKVEASEVMKIKDSTVRGDVEATSGDVTKIKGSSTVEGDVIATGDVTLKGSTTVEGDVDAGGTVEVLENATVEGQIK